MLISERVAEWLRRLTRKPKVRTAVGSNPTLDSLVAVRYTSPGRPEPCEGNLVAVAGSCGGVMVRHPWPLLEISLSDFRGLATLNINTFLPILERNQNDVIRRTEAGHWTEAVVFLLPRKPHCSEMSNPLDDKVCFLSLFSFPKDDNVFFDCICMSEINPGFRLVSRICIFCGVMAKSPASLVKT